MRKVIGFLLLWWAAILLLITLKLLGIAPVAGWDWGLVLCPLWGMWLVGLLAYAAHCLVGHDG